MNPWTTHASMTECPACNGEGRRIEAIQGGRWNHYVGTWEPDERDAGPCTECDGRGEVPVALCDRCNLPTEEERFEVTRTLGECSCSEELMLEWHAKVLPELEVEEAA